MPLTEKPETGHAAAAREAPGRPLRARARSRRRIPTHRLALIFGVALLMAVGYGMAAPGALDRGFGADGPRGSGLGAAQPSTCIFGGDRDAVITLSKSTGPASTSIWVNGTGFATYGAVDIWWTEMTPAAGTPEEAGTSTAQSSGTFSDRISVPPAGPAYPVGTYNLTAEDTYNDCGYAAFALTTASTASPQLVIEYPTSGLAGTLTSVDGSYFSAGATIDPVAIGGADVTCSGGGPTVSGAGTFTCEFAVPDSLSAGVYSVTAYDPTDGTIVSTNSFTDTGGQTTTTVSCAPDPIGAAPSGASPEFSTNCTATVTGDAPTGAVDWSSSSGTGVFFTWFEVDGYPDITLTDSCTLDGSGQCTITYSDTSIGSPTITGAYGGDYANAASAGLFGITILAATNPTILVLCSPSEVTSTATCTATVTGNDPTGEISWTAGSLGSSSGTFSSDACTLASGGCSVTYTSPGFSGGCDPFEPQDCGLPVEITAAYSGDALNAPASGTYYVTVTSPSSEYEAYTPVASAGVPCNVYSSDCQIYGSNEGGFGSEGATSDAADAATVPGTPPTDEAGEFSALASSEGGEVSLTGNSANAGYGYGTVEAADSSGVSGSCDMSSDSENLAPCLGVSLSIGGDEVAECTAASDFTCAYALVYAFVSFTMCDLNPDSGDGSGDACTTEEIYGLACAGEDCPELQEDECASDFNPLCTDGCQYTDGPDGDIDCAEQGSAETDLESPGPDDFGSGDDVASGDTLSYSVYGYGGIEASGGADADLDLDPTVQLVDLDPAGVTISTPAAVTAAANQPSALQVVNSVTPTFTAAGDSITDNVNLTNAGNSALTGIEVIGSMEGPLSCPSESLAIGGQENCTATLIAPAPPGINTDYIVANGTNASDGDVFGESSASFQVAPTDHAVALTESGLAPGASWSVLTNGTLETSSSPTITLELPYGVYSYEVIAPPGNISNPGVGSFTVYGSDVSLTSSFAPGVEGPAIAAVAELLNLYGQRADLQTEFPDANESLSGFANLVAWAGAVVGGGTSDPAYAQLAPYGYWYVLLTTYNERVDLQSAFPDAYTAWTSYTDLVDWAGGVVTDMYPDSAAPSLAAYGWWYALMLTYNGRADLQQAYPDAMTNLTNYTGLLIWAGEVVDGSFVDSSATTLQPFGYYYDLLLVYESRADLESAFPNVTTDESSFDLLVLWAGGVSSGSYSDGDQSMLAPYAYWYVLFGAVYEHRADLQAAFLDAFTDGLSYTALFGWAGAVVSGEITDSSYSLLLPFASDYAPPP